MVREGVMGTHHCGDLGRTKLGDKCRSLAKHGANLEMRKEQLWCVGPGAEPQVMTYPAQNGEDHH